MKKFQSIASWGLGILALFVVIGFTEAELAKVALSDISVNIDTRGGNFFVTQDEIKETVTEKGYVVDAVSLGSVNIKALEDFFDLYPAVKKSEVYTTPDGFVFVNIKQRTPIARVFTLDGSSFYMDQDGKLMPLSNSYTSRVPIVNGKINGSFNKLYQVDFSNIDSINTKDPTQLRLHNIFNLISYINKDPFWDAQFTQVYVSENGEFELIPRVGNHTIILGNAQSIEEKLNTLRIFYKEGLNKIGWNAYTSINLKFKNQVVCTKRTHYGIN